MERLTGYEIIVGHCHNIPLVDTQLVVDRLAAYEDTGLTPEQVKAQQWIPASDPPKDDKMQLVACRSKNGAYSVNRAYYDGQSWHGSGSMANVTHYMPLPEPPKEADDE